MKKIILLADKNSPHTKKWYSGLVKQGYDIKIWDFDRKRVKLFQIVELTRFINEFKPDIIHAHYASSYGLMGALLNFSPFFISVWGSDVYQFPNLGFINKMILKYNFKKANQILSTSKVMIKEIKKYTNKDIIYLPFGIDTKVFKPIDKVEKKDIVTLGIVKHLKPIYAIDYAIKSIDQLVHNMNIKNIHLMIIGGGSEYYYLKRLVLDLSLSNYITFIGEVPHNKIVNYHNKIDILLNISHEESFGVSVLESSSCQNPVIVSSVSGLVEIVENNTTGLIIEPNNIEQLADAIKKLIDDEGFRIELGINGRKRVEMLYDWNDNIKQMCNIYDSFN